MSMLELITNAVSNPNSIHLVSESDYPIVLNPDPIFPTLKPISDGSSDVLSGNTSSFVTRVAGWKISETDAEVVELGKKFYNRLSKKMKKMKSFEKDEFVAMLDKYLEKNGERVGVVVEAGERGSVGYSVKLVEKLGFLMGGPVSGLVLEACVAFEIWELVETLIVNWLVEKTRSSFLVRSLVEKRRSDLVCSCLKHLSDLEASAVLLVLKYFLSPPNDAYGCMVSVRKEWESQALLAIEKACDKSLGKKRTSLAKDASVLLMIAHDEFSVSELCLHYLLLSPSLDEVMFSSCISKLNGSEMLAFVLYLKKWLKKYENFPQVCPCPKASSALGLKVCDWVPTLEIVVKCLGLVLDEHFPSVVMHPEFHEEVKSITSVVYSFTSEARLCSTLSNYVGALRTDVKG